MGVYDLGSFRATRLSLTSPVLDQIDGASTARRSLFLARGNAKRHTHTHTLHLPPRERRDSREGTKDSSEIPRESISSPSRTTLSRSSVAGQVGRRRRASGSSHLAALLLVDKRRKKHGRNRVRTRERDTRRPGTTGEEDDDGEHRRRGGERKACGASKRVLS